MENSLGSVVASAIFAKIFGNIYHFLLRIWLGLRLYQAYRWNYCIFIPLVTCLAPCVASANGVDLVAMGWSCLSNRSVPLARST